MFNSKFGFLFVLVAVFAGLTFGWVSAASAADVVFSPNQVEPVKVKRATRADKAPVCYRVAARLLVCDKAPSAKGGR